METPKFLLEMSKQLNEQDNRCTADPIWQVRCKRTRVTASEYTDTFEIIDSDEGFPIATSKSDLDVNEQIVDHLQCDEDDLPIIFESWVDDNYDDDDELTGAEKIEFFLDNFDPEYNELDGFNLIWVEEYEDIIKGAFLTESDANWFIRRKQHDYPKLYTYVESMYHCPQMIELRNWIKGLTNE